MDLFFTENTSWQLAWAVGVTLVSAYAHGVLGLGFVSVAMPLLIFFVSFRTAMIITVVCSLLLLHAAGKSSFPGVFLFLNVYYHACHD